MAKGIPIRSAEIRRIRTEQLLLSQPAMAAAMGISHSNLQRIEGSPRVSVMPQTIRRLAELLKKEPSEMVAILRDPAA